MTKSQLINIVSAQTGRDKPEVEAVLASVLAAVVNALLTNQRVDLRGFGSLVVKQKKERRAVIRGLAITIAAKRDASFKASKELSEKLIQPKAANRPV